MAGMIRPWPQGRIIPTRPGLRQRARRCIQLGMSRLVIFCVLLAAVVVRGVHAAPEASLRGIKRAFAVTPGCTLVVDTYHGEIAVEESEGSEIRIELNVDFDVQTEADATRLWEGLKTSFDSANNTVRVVARNDVATGPRLSWNDERRMNLYYRITVPRQCHVDLKTGRGKVMVGRLAGRMSARVEAGTIFFRQIDGSIDAATGEGELVISRCSGAVKARVRQGSIRVGTIGGAADLRTANGSVEVMQARSGLKVQAEVGDVTVNFPRDYSGNANLTSLGGNVTVQVDPAANCDLDAAAAWGRVRNKLPLTGVSGGDGQRRVSGRLNRGGAKIKVLADGGAVTLAPGETLFEEVK